MHVKCIICDLFQIFKGSVAAVLPENLINKNLSYRPDLEQLTVCGDTYNIRNKNIYLVGFGKAVRNMAIEVESILSSKIRKGIISIPEGSLPHTSNNVFYCQGAKNNLPDANAEKSAKRIYDLANDLKKDDLLLVLISGGGSALLSLPRLPITLEEKINIIKMLANAGADITELNTVRKQLSDIKGGKLAVKAQPAQVISLILSDIVGDPIDLIASGPTVENKDDTIKTLNIIGKYSLLDKLPYSIKSILEIRDDGPCFPRNNVKNHIIGSNRISMEAAIEEAKKLNYIPMALSNTITGNVKTVAEQYTRLTEVVCDFFKGEFNNEMLQAHIQTLCLPEFILDQDLLSSFENKKIKGICLILGGEITVEVKGSGKGGRNQQLALEFSNNLNKIKEKIKDFDVHLLSAGTDGIDGPTDAAGAIGFKDLVSEAKEQNLNVQVYLDNNDSYNFYKTFKKEMYHIITGHTNTNVMDIHLITIRKI